jgi:hypothetical protein
MVEPVMVCE